MLRLAPERREGAPRGAPSHERSIEECRARLTSVSYGGSPSYLPVAANDQQEQTPVVASQGVPLHFPDGWPGFSHAQHAALNTLLWQLWQAVDVLWQW